MVSPITGPFTRTITVLGAPIHTGYKPTVVSASYRWFRQKPPYSNPLPFNLDKYVALSASFTGTYDGYTEPNAAGSYDVSQVDYAINKSYSKLVETIGNYSQWANNLLEAEKTLETGLRAAKTLYEFTVALRKFNFRGAAEILGMKRPRTVSRRKKFADNWLAYHFGWEPLVQDLGAGVLALGRDFSPYRVSGRGSSSTGAQSLVQRNGTQGSITTTFTDTKCRHDAYVRIVNPNVSLLSELGFINPASVLWEAVPFSFVVDWFTNVGQVLASATDLLGKELTFSSTTVFQVRYWSYSSWGVVPGPINPPSSGPWAAAQSAKSVFVRRTTGLTGPVLKVKPFRGFSAVRGATAVALLLQLLKS